MDPLRAELSPPQSASRKGRVEKAAPSRRAVEERKGVSPSFVDPAPIINIVEAHLNRPSLRVKRTIALHRIKRS
jgi:hypothetical protein